MKLYWKPLNSNEDGTITAEAIFETIYLCANNEW